MLILYIWSATDTKTFKFAFWVLEKANIIFHYFLTCYKPANINYNSQVTNLVQVRIDRNSLTMNL